jgi:predicted Ser/Thr protein kinase
MSFEEDNKLDKEVLRHMIKTESQEKKIKLTFGISPLVRRANGGI